MCSPPLISLNTGLNTANPPPYVYLSGDANSLGEVYGVTAAARAHAATGRPALAVWNGVQRRFGHAATDRQTAYLTTKEASRVQNPIP